MPRRYPIFQFPNPPLVAAIMFGALARITRGPAARAAALASALARLVWAYQEITDGANRFRRLLGLAGTAHAATQLARAARPATRPGDRCEPRRC